MVGPGFRQGVGATQRPFLGIADHQNPLQAISQQAPADGAGFVLDGQPERSEWLLRQRCALSYALPFVALALLLQRLGGIRVDPRIRAHGGFGWIRAPAGGRAEPLL